MKITMRGGAKAYDANTIKLLHDGEGIDVTLNTNEAMVIQRTDYRSFAWGANVGQQLSGFPKTKTYLINGGAFSDVDALASLQGKFPGLNTVRIDEFVQEFWSIRLREASGGEINDDMVLELQGAVTMTKQKDKDTGLDVTVIDKADPNLPPPPPPADEQGDMYWEMVLTALGWIAGGIALCLGCYIGYRVYRHYRHGDVMFPRLKKLMGGGGDG